MTWVHLPGWDEDVLDAVVQLHDLDRGVVVVPARPRQNRPRGALLDTLTALGKICTPYGQPNELEHTRHVTRAWLRGEGIHTVILYSAQRWHPSCIDELAAVTSVAGAELIVVTTHEPGPRGKRHLTDRHGAPVKDLDALTGLDSPGPGPALEHPYSRLRRCRLPYVAAIGIALCAGAEAEDLVDVAVEAAPATGDSLEISAGCLHLPAGGGRLLRAQQVAAQLAGCDRLFQRPGEDLGVRTITYARILVCREAGILPGPGDLEVDTTWPGESPPVLAAITGLP